MITPVTWDIRPHRQENASISYVVERFETLACLITPEIEMYRFDLNEHWRAGVRVMRRARIN